MWERWRNDHPEATRLPAVIPLILHHGERKWVSPLRFAELFDLEDDARAGLAPLLVDFRALIDDLTFTRDELLLARAMADAAKLTLFFLRHARDPAGTLAEHVVAALDVFRSCLDAPAGRADLRWILSYLSIVRDGDDNRAIHALLDQLGDPRMNQVKLSYADELRAEARAEGHSRGRRELLRKQIERRFGILPAAIVARIDAAESAELDQLGLDLIDAPSLEALFGE